MACSCKDWKENIDKLNSGFVLQSVHGMGGYSGKKIAFCPWCGKKLKEKESSSVWICDEHGTQNCKECRKK